MNSRIPMNRRIICLAASILLSACAARPADEDALRTENAQLKAQLATMQRQIDGTPGPAAPAFSPAPASSPAPAAAPAQANTSHRDIAPSTDEYTGVDTGDAYAHTGCTHGVFDKSPDSAWRHAESWAAMRNGMTPYQVEDWLGSEHYTIRSGGQSGGRMIWQFGKCGDSAQGTVSFAGNRVVSWDHPEFSQDD